MRAVTVVTLVIDVPEVDHPVGALQGGSGARAAGIRSGLGFGQAEAGQRAACHQVRQPALLLFRRAIGEDRVDPESDARRERDADGLVDIPQFLDGDAQAGEGTTVAVLQAAAEGLGHDQPKEPEVPQLGHEFDREVGLLVPGRYLRRYLVSRELAHKRAKLLMVNSQLEHLSLFSSAW